MRIGCLQFAPQVGDVDNNLNRADAVLNRANTEDLDLLVLPELAFSGYNFKSLNDISPFLEPSGAGITSLWARTTALKYNCVVAAGYPEKVDVSRKWPTSPEYYNSVIVVNEDGETIANYRKSHLYYTDETWALEGNSGFYQGDIPGIGRTAMGICMDINPYRFEAPWSAFEFAFHVLDVRANVVILSMAWLTRESAGEFSSMPNEPDMDTLTYWVSRLEPLIRSENDEEMIVIFANRTGMEGDAVYAGTSAVLGVKAGEVSVYGLLGRGEKELLVVDTSVEPLAQLVYRPGQDLGAEDGTSHTEGAEETKDNSSGGDTQSPSSSTDPNFSNTAGPQTGKSESSRGSHGVPRDETRHISDGFISPDAFTPMIATPPSNPFEDSPITPRYFWFSPDHSRTPASPPSETSSTRSNHTESSFVPEAAQLTKGVSHEDTYEFSTTCNLDPSQVAEFTDLVESLCKTNSTEDPPTARPSAPKLRNGSRAGRHERSDSVLAQRPPTGFSSRTAGTPAEPAHTDTPRSRKASRSRNPTLALETQVNAPGHQTNASPELEKIGADLMIFEEGRRPRRDSLVCHADDDDFIVLHSSRRDQIKSPKKDSHHSTHKQGNKENNPAIGRKESVRGTSSRRTGTPKQLDSSGFKYQQSQPESTHSSGLPEESPELPASRNASRGRSRKAAWSPKKESPKLPQHRSPALASPPYRHGHSGSLGQPSPLSPYKNSERASDDKPKPIGRLGRRRDSNKIPSVKDAGKAHDYLGGGLGIFASPVTAVDAKGPPKTPVDVPVTPKAMILIPDMDETQDGPGAPKTTIKTTIVEAIPLKCVERATEIKYNRPKSLVW
ncbi:carbon-nitrogen hydrolase [Whalleya microplaca]|nr:carbon-nitrogen hydrolase [Whalleya microplaca]